MSIESPMGSYLDMNICLISLSPVGGFKSFIENIALHFLRLGCRVTFLSLSKECCLDITGVEVRCLDLNSVSRINEITISERIDSVIKRAMFRMKHNPTDWDDLQNNLYHSQLKALSRARSCNKVDLSKFDCVISCEEVQCNYFLAYSVLAKRKIGYIHPDYNNVPYNKKLDRKALSKLDYICATSEANAETIRKAQPSLKDKVIGVPNPIDVESILKKSESQIEELFSSDVVNLITVCRLDNSYKALDRLLSISLKLKNNGDKYIWRVIGDGEYGQTMHEFIRKNDLQDYVKMLGAMDNPIPYVKQSDLFVLQSYSEGYPMSVLEALAVNTPVLVTDYPSSSEQVDDRVTGFIVKNDFDYVYEKIHYLINNRSELNRVRKHLQETDKSKLDSIDNLLNIMR